MHTKHLRGAQEKLEFGCELDHSQPRLFPMHIQYICDTYYHDLKWSGFS